MTWPFATLLAISTSTKTTAEQIAQATRQIPTVIIFDIWKTIVTPKHNPQNKNYLVRPTGAWYIAVGLLEYNGQSPTTDPQKSRERLPGYLRINGSSCFLNYEDRRPHCTRCQSDAYDSFHDRDNCIFLDCRKCGTKGDHPPKQCPTNITDNNRKSKTHSDKFNQPIGVGEMTLTTTEPTAYHPPTPLLGLSQQVQQQPQANANAQVHPIPPLVHSSPANQPPPQENANYMEEEL